MPGGGGKEKTPFLPGRGRGKENPRGPPGFLGVPAGPGSRLELSPRVSKTRAKRLWRGRNL